MKKEILKNIVTRFVISFVILLMATVSTQASVISEIPPPPGSGAFGTFIAILPNGNIIVTDPLFDAPGPVADVGAVHLYNGTTLALIASLTGSTANDQVSSGGVTVLPNGNYVVRSPNWDNPSPATSNVGAVTFCNGATGFSGAVSPANSLVGGRLNDQVGFNGITILSNGNFVVRSTLWDNPSPVTSNVGAVTWCSGTSGCIGLVSDTNSLIGSTALDAVGSFSITTLNNGNFVVRSPQWDNGTTDSAGAVTLCNGTTGCAGAVTTSNSLVGSTASDQIGNSGVTGLGNGNYVVRSPSWDNGLISNVGAATFCDGTAGCTGPVSTSNSLVGSLMNDNVGGSGVTELANGNYVVISTAWDNPAPLSGNVGAATLCSGTSGCTGAVSASNSLIGSTAGDLVGAGGITALPNGNYVVTSSLWDNGLISNAGAATFCNGTSGCTGAVSSANSMVGGTASDNVGSGGVTVLTNGNYVVSSPFWDNGAITDAGSVAFCLAATGCIGAFDGFNSPAINSPASHFRYGTTRWGSSLAGSRGVTPLLNGGYIISIPDADPYDVIDAGMVVKCAANGCNGEMSEAQALYGTSAGDMVGFNGVLPLFQGNKYVVLSAPWNKVATPKVGAATLCDANTGSCEDQAVTPDNSLTGMSADDCLGGRCDTSVPCATALPNGDYGVCSPTVDIETVPDAGMVAHCKSENNSCAGKTPSATTALVGTTAGDSVGDFGSIVPLDPCDPDGTGAPCQGCPALSATSFNIRVQFFDNGAATDAGAVVHGAGNGGTIGEITTQNAVIGMASRTTLNDVFVTDGCRGWTVVGFRDQNRVAVFRSLYSAVNSGSFTNPSTWDLNNVPSVIDDVFIPNGLTVTLDTITSVNSVKVGCTGSLTGGSASGFIQTVIEKKYCSTGIFEYPVGTIADGNEYSPVQVTITNLATNPSSLTVEVRKGTVPATPPVLSTTHLNRFWLVRETGDLTANVLFNYLQTDVDGDENQYRILRVQGDGVAQYFTNGTPCPGAGSPCVDANANTMFISGVSDFSDWSAGIPAAPSAVELIRAWATAYETGVMFEWQTGFESDNLGFNIYRDEAGKLSRVNEQLVAGSALVAGSTLRAGQAYASWDNTQSKAAAYWLEDIDLGGKSTWHGPFFPKQAGGGPPDKSRAAFLSEVANNGANAAASRPIERTVAISPPPGEQVRFQASLAARAAGKILAARAAVKIYVKREGWYRVSQKELVSAGLDPNIDARFLRMFAEGREQPIIVSAGKQGLFDESSSIEFYGVGLDTAATGARVYWLVADKQDGLRVQQVKSEGAPSSSRSFSQSIERKDRTIYFAALRNGERENFFGAVVTTGGVDQEITLRRLDQTNTQSALIEVALQGVTALPHRVAVHLNTSLIGEVSFDGQQQGVAQMPAPQALLKQGSNTIRLTAVAGASDVSLVDSIRVSYQHTFTADNDELKLTARGAEQVRIDGFTSPNIRVFDVSNPEAVEEVIGLINRQKRSYAITVASPAVGERTLMAVASEAVRQPVSIKANQPSEWRARSRAADLLIITRGEFFPALEGLKRVREGEGYKVALVDIEDVYDEFSFGEKSPQAVKDFLSFATANWKVAPRFLLLAGDASYDPRDYLGLGDTDVVPTKLADTAYLETASDDWFVDFDGDGLAELSVGRLPARSPEEALNLVGKTIGYAKSPPMDEALLVADSNEGFDFEAASAQLQTLIPPGIKVEQINRGRVVPAAAKQQLLEAIARGQKVINYIGHGSANTWNGALLSAAEARELTNAGRLPVFVMMTCLNGYFHDAAADSLAESLLKAERGGAVAVWASTGLTLPQEQALLNQALYRSMFNAGTFRQPRTLGEAVRNVKREISDIDIRRTWVLLGDPTLRLK